MAPLEARAKELRDEVEQESLEIDAAIASAIGTRAAEAAQLPAALSDRYEKLRERLKGTGAARLIKSHCDGCHLELSVGRGRAHPRAAAGGGRDVRAVRAHPRPQLNRPTQVRRAC